RGGRRPVPVAVAGAAPQVQQHVPIPPEQHVSGRNHAEPHRPSLEGPTLLFPDPLILSPMKLSTQLQYGDDPVGQIEKVVDWEKAGLDVVWVAQAYSFGL